MRLIIAGSDKVHQNSSIGNIPMLLFSFKNICSFIFVEHVSRAPRVLIYGLVIVRVTDSVSK
jgi:hypothetical protein